MKLFYWPKTRAFRALWMLEEMRVPYELEFVNIRAGAQNDAEFLPRQSDVEAARAGRRQRARGRIGRGAAVSRGSLSGNRARRAACTTLRAAAFLQWMFFTGSCLEPAMAERMTGAPGNTVSFGWGDLARVEHAIESALEEGPWLLGEQFTAADILAASTLQIAFIAKLIEPQGVLFDYVERALAREGLRTRVSDRSSRGGAARRSSPHVGVSRMGVEAKDQGNARGFGMPAPASISDDSALMRELDGFGLVGETVIAADGRPRLHGLVVMTDLVLRVPARALKLDRPHVDGVDAV